MNIVTLLQPLRIVFGDGCAPQCAELFARRGVGCVLLVTSTPVRSTLVALLEALNLAGIVVVECPPVDTEPTIAMFEAALKVARAEKVKAVLGVGGCSPMDVAKLVAAVARGTQTAREVFGINLLKGRCIEAYANKFAHPAVDLYALNGVRLISAHLLRAIRNGADAEARANLALGSMFDGLCLGPVNTGAVHALAYPQGGEFHVTHGVPNALLLPHVLRYKLSAAPERYAEIALALGVEHAGSAQATAERGVEHVAHWSQECGVAQKLSEVGVPRDAIPRMAGSAMTVTRLLNNNLRPVTELEAVRIYESAY